MFLQILNSSNQSEEDPPYRNGISMRIQLLHPPLVPQLPPNPLSQDFTLHSDQSKDLHTWAHSIPLKNPSPKFLGEMNFLILFHFYLLINFCLFVF